MTRTEVFEALDPTPPGGFELSYAPGIADRLDVVLCWDAHDGTFDLVPASYGEATMRKLNRHFIVPAGPKPPLQPSEADVERLAQVLYGRLYMGWLHLSDQEKGDWRRVAGAAYREIK